MTADFSRLIKHLDDGLREHAEQEWPDSPVLRAVFLSRGGHAPGASCAIDGPWKPPEHVYYCLYPEDECLGLPCAQIRGEA